MVHKRIINKDCTVKNNNERGYVQDYKTLCNEQSPKYSDDTRCCTNTIVLLKMSTIVLETCRGI